jgi:hypothetical protein
MVDFFKSHWAKLVAFVAGWVGEAQVGFSSYVDAVFVALGLK